MILFDFSLLRRTGDHFSLFLSQAHMQETSSYSSQFRRVPFSTVAILFRDLHKIAIRYWRVREAYASGKFSAVIEIDEMAHTRGFVYNPFLIARPPSRGAVLF